VRTKDVQLVSKLSQNIGALLQQGVNVSNYGPQYYVSTLNKIRPELLSEATKDAKARAEAIDRSGRGKSWIYYLSESWANSSHNTRFNNDFRLRNV